MRPFVFRPAGPMHWSDKTWDVGESRYLQAPLRISKNWAETGAFFGSSNWLWALHFSNRRCTTACLVDVDVTQEILDDDGEIESCTFLDGEVGLRHTLIAHHDASRQLRQFALSEMRDALEYADHGFMDDCKSPSCDDIEQMDYTNPLHGMVRDAYWYSTELFRRNASIDEWVDHNYRFQPILQLCRCPEHVAYDEWVTGRGQVLNRVGSAIHHGIESCPCRAARFLAMRAFKFGLKPDEVRDRVVYEHMLVKLNELLNPLFGL